MQTRASMRYGQKAAQVMNIPCVSRTPSIIRALIVNGFQLQLTGVNMIAGCLPSLASFHGSQLCMSSDGWALDAANGSAFAFVFTLLRDMSCEMRSQLTTVPSLIVL